MKRVLKWIWKPIVIILVSTIMVTDVIIDMRANEHEAPINVTDSKLDLTVGTALGELAPDFTATTLEGDSIQLSNLRGKIVLINIFATWCGPCIAETPHLVEVYDKLRDEDVEFVGLNLQENPETIDRFRDEFGIEYPLVLNEDGFLTKSLYQPIGLPTSWFLDENGVVRYVFTGAITQGALEQVIADVQAGREPNPFAVTK